MGKGGEDYGKREIISPKPSDREVFPAWSKQISKCEEHYKVKKGSGLGSIDVERQCEIYGYNELEKHEGQSIWSLVVEQFKDTLVRILLVAAVVSFVLALYDGLRNGEEELRKVGMKNKTDEMIWCKLPHNTFSRTLTWHNLTRGLLFA